MQVPATREKIKARIEAKIDRTPDGHVLWLSNDQGLMSVNYHTVSAARVLWELEGGFDLTGTVLRRTCSEGQCIAPAHHQRVVTTREKARGLAYYLETPGAHKPYLSPKPSDATLVEGVRQKMLAEVDDKRRQRETKKAVGVSIVASRPPTVPVPPPAPLEAKPRRQWITLPEPEWEPDPIVEEAAAHVAPPVKLPPVAPSPYTSVVGPFGSGGIIVFTPWGTFNGELVLRDLPK